MVGVSPAALETVLRQYLVLNKPGPDLGDAEVIVPFKALSWSLGQEKSLKWGQVPCGLMRHCVSCGEMQQ